MLTDLPRPRMRPGLCCALALAAGLAAPVRRADAQDSQTSVLRCNGRELGHVRLAPGVATHPTRGSFSLAQGDVRTVTLGSATRDPTRRFVTDHRLVDARSPSFL